MPEPTGNPESFATEGSPPPSTDDERYLRELSMMPHDSGIVPVERPDFLLMSIIFLVFCNIAFGAITNTILFVLYAAMMATLPWLLQQRDRLPRWLGWIFEQISDRVQAYPQEVILIVGVAALTISKWLPLETTRWREFGLVILVVAGYWMSRRGSLLQSGYLTRRKGWLSKLLNGEDEEEAREEAELPEQPKPIVGYDGETLRKPSLPIQESHSATREVWERKQRQRWEDWMREELDRLDGDYDRSNH